MPLPIKGWYEDDHYQAHPSTETAFLRFLRERARENELYELARDTRLSQWVLGGFLIVLGFVVLVACLAFYG